MFGRRLMILSLVSAVALVAAATAVAATVVVSPGHLADWRAVHENCDSGASTGSIAFVGGPGAPPLGDGSVRYTIGADGDSYETLRQGGYNGVRLADFTRLDYWTYVSQAAGTQAVYIDLYVDSDGNGTKDVTLTFEPTYNGTVAKNSWQHWNALAGQWWSDPPGGPPPFTTLAAFIAAHANAKLATDSGRAFLLSAGCGGSAWTNFVGNADALTIGVSGRDTTYNFEPTPAGPPENKGKGKGKGIEKVTLCHKGHTIRVAKPALKAHLAHGDHLGAC
jgi:hypothetical protein